MIGASLTHYRITARLGAGGMGEVYRATDTRLGREVAIKILPQSVSRDPQSLLRFEREARALAALNHPHIAAIHGIEQDQSTHFLVLELVEGETLEERLRPGALPLAQALVIARQIAEAMQEAHDKGVVHRDLKPGNVKLTPNGRVKVLDFGLAKMAQAIRAGAPPAHPSGADADAPTLPAETTTPGAVMGTPAYIDPEQARGLEVDKRTDVWAFGCCLFECLSGSKPFQGRSASDLIAEVLKSEPDWSRVPAATPREIEKGVKPLLRSSLTTGRLFCHGRAMPRQVRNQYPGAMYHAMSRGNRRQDIFLDDVDRQDFLKTLAEACQKTGWQVHAYCLMSNHYHLVVETPNANLVAGMAWLQSAYTIRLNHRHKLIGHVLSGRYKAQLVEGSGNGYLRTACDYVHLNPVRAGLLKADERLLAYPWSSFGYTRVASITGGVAKKQIPISEPVTFLWRPGPTR